MKKQRVRFLDEEILWWRSQKVQLKREIELLELEKEKLEENLVSWELKIKKVIVKFFNRSWKKRVCFLFLYQSIMFYRLFLLQFIVLVCIRITLFRENKVDQFSLKVILKSTRR